MARPKNDGKGRIGGRSKGTPNKTTATVKTWVATLLSKNRKQIEADLKGMTPADRVKVLFGLLPYVIPKQQALEATVEDITEGRSHKPVIVFPIDGESEADYKRRCDEAMADGETVICFDSPVSGSNAAVDGISQEEVTKDER